MLQVKSYILTDGVNTHGKIHPLNAAEMAKDFDIRVYTIGVGTNGQAKTPVAIDPFSGRYIYDYVEVEIDEETLKTIAKETGGQYFRATDNQKLKEVYKEINEMEKAKIKTMNTMWIYLKSRLIYTGCIRASFTGVFGK